MCAPPASKRDATPLDPVKRLPNPPASVRLGVRSQLTGVPCDQSPKDAIFASWSSRIRFWSQECGCGILPESEGGKRGREILGRSDFRADRQPGGLGGVATVQYNQSFLDAVSDF